MVQIEVEPSLAERARELSARHATTDTRELIALAVRSLYAGRIAVVSSFGAESAILLHLVAEVDKSVPVLFVDTDKLFGETLRYRDRLVDRLGLTDVRTLAPDPARIAGADPMGSLWLQNSDLCCQIRKVEPLARGLAGFDAWISGRKRYQSAARATIPLFEADGRRLKINPLAAWGPEQLVSYAAKHDLPEHPLVAQGYPSIGCMPCTDPVQPGEDARSGRWRGLDKTECGIHLAGRIKTEEREGSGI
ncbi:MAG: phosphoadenylyl-sulfate reductase [Ancalomicrobiaceae bacterium]|nr:phosphoadenylyl-sulfate reductase [Ancalomicrobiaceae bacterium]